MEARKWRRAAALLFSVAAATAANAAEPARVTIHNFSFSPMVLSVPIGTRVVFDNQDDLPHTVVIPDLDQHSAMLDTNEKFETSMDKPGTYTFFCSVHPKMTGQIIVTGK